ncbi:MraY family glycosyltransferase [Microbispora hainanensis]|uniref:Undecaprenyl/decaprenyl-phosphate alpha-N-acetylglucosaminyl 1-phosphate transferase n=1 Tax=Microbispora hainanensis TaxID=568844 RepID=A0ABZ1T179_9ACTN|nr:MraY family glycosyltransferase [Microbispora hainanensis]
MNASAILAAGCAGIVLSAAATFLLRRLALRWGITDRPSGHKSHLHPTPYLGGVAITLGTVVPAIALGAFEGPAAGILVGAVAMTLLGLIDDLIPLPQLTRLAIEALAAGVAVLCGIVAPVTGGPLDVLITLLWIVVVTNSFNLLDNMDGVLGGVTAVSATCLAAAAFVSGQPLIGLVLVTLSPAALGFLLYNWAPARIFMGDAGSLFIGFVLACSAALLAGTAAPAGGPGAAIASLLLPTFVSTVDTGVVLLSRWRAGRPLLCGGTDHLSHRLRRLGLGTRLTAVTLAAGAAAAGTAYLALVLGWIPPLGAAIGAAAVACLAVLLPQRIPVYPAARPQPSLPVRR